MKNKILFISILIIMLLSLKDCIYADALSDYKQQLLEVQQKKKDTANALEGIDKEIANYIYDITLNFSRNNMYEFYEWKEEDDPEFILKIPLYKVDEETFYDLKNNDVIVSKKLLELIEDKTEIYTPTSINLIRYACVFTSENSAFALEFDSDGNNYMKSNLSIDEESEVIDSSKNIKY